MKYKIAKPITKENILEYLTQEQLMEYFTRIPIDTPLFCSPLRVDNNPSCSYYKPDSGILYLKDWARNRSYTVWEVGSKIKELSYYKLLDYIVRAFSLPLSNWCVLTVDSDKKYKQPIVDIKPNEPKIKYTFEPVYKNEIEHLDYWLDYGITKELLNQYKVKQAEYIQSGSKYIIDLTNPIYVFTDFPGSRLKIYRPLADKKNKWKSTTEKHDIFGSSQIPFLGSQCLFITSSMKDLLVLRTMGFHAIAPMSEQILIQKDIMNHLSKVFKYIFILFDDDEAGIKGAAAYKRQYPFVHIVYIGHPYFKQKGLKDISDYRKKLGYHKALKRLRKCISRALKFGYSQKV